MDQNMQNTCDVIERHSLFAYNFHIKKSGSDEFYGADELSGALKLLRTKKGHFMKQTIIPLKKLSNHVNLISLCPSCEYKIWHLNCQIH